MKRFGNVAETKTKRFSNCLRTETESDSSLRSQSASELRSTNRAVLSVLPEARRPSSGRKEIPTIVRAGADPEQIIAAAERYAAAHRIAGTDKQFIPAPAVWLNKGGYLSGTCRKPARRPRSVSTSACHHVNSPRARSKPMQPDRQLS